MANRDILAIGTSAGGVQALLHLAKNFTPKFPASILVTIHLPSHFNSSLDKIITRSGPLPASFASQGEAPKKGHIYIAPPGFHLLLDGSKLVLGTGPRENNTRPAIDPMLRSVGVCCAGRGVGVVLTGTQGDGASGLWALGRCGGKTVVQDPRDAAFPEMPVAALSRAKPDYVVPLAQMPALLTDLVHRRASESVEVPEPIRFEVEIAKGGDSSMSEMDRVGRRSVLSCPDCGGVMWEIDEDDLIRFRCHVGHAYTAELMSLALDENLRRALATARRGYEERSALLRRMEESAAANGHNQLAERWRCEAADYHKQADVIEQAMRRLDRMAAQSEKA